MKKTRAYYNAISKGYDELYGREQEEKWDALKTFVQGKTLDIGCGTGIITKHIKNVVGLDSSPGMLAHLSGIKVIGDACALPFKDKSFDTALSLTLLQDVSEPERAIREMKRVSKRVVFSVLKKTWTTARVLSITAKQGLKGRVIEHTKDIFFVQD
ncbi:hypothetical protein COT72_02195 [archaeon CG10_big_fil_rev_8_21_14_0_10_43_11]|nr:MAG: hypothetical protein COT72_02195 [archaeon CG10_big_fil_rev_8_21_14_0_10_43_11]